MFMQNLTLNSLILTVCLGASFLNIARANSGKPDDIPMTTASNAPMKDCSNREQYEKVEDCFALFMEANQGFKMVHRDADGNPVKTRHVALLLHGLSDSPYFYRDIAQTLFNHGINVIAPRHTGHGTRDYHLQRVSRFDWREDFKWSKTEAQKLGEEIILGGMSLGGSLVMRETLYESVKPAGLLLFSPALIMPWKFRLSCIFKGGYEAEKTYGVGVRYQKISNNGTCELYRVNKEIRKKSYMLETLDIPVFGALTVYDTAIEMDKTYNFIKRLNATGKAQLALFTGLGRTDAEGNPLDASKLPFDTTIIEVEQELPHASVLLKSSDKDFTPETNPRYEDMNVELQRFLGRYF